MKKAETGILVFLLTLILIALIVIGFFLYKSNITAPTTGNAILQTPPQTIVKVVNLEPTQEDSRKFTPSTTVLNAPLYANAWNVKSDGTVNIEVKNNGGDTIILSTFKVMNAEQGGFIVTCKVGALSDILNPGESTTITSTCRNGALISGKTFKADISVEYIKSGGSLILSSTGTIADKVV